MTSDDHGGGAEAPATRSAIPPVVQAIALVLLVFIAYSRSFHGEFLWDDDSNVTDRVALRSMDGLRQIWFQPGATQQYYPITHSTFWLDYHLWGINPLPFHVENVLLHAAVCVLLWLLLRRLGVRGAWLGAAIFGLHPVGVETVAWITERKNTLSAVFFLGALIAAVRFWLPTQVPGKNLSDEDRGPWKFYWFALALYLCALLSKTSTVAVPVVILLLIWWKRGRIGRRDPLLLLPFFALGVVAGLFTMWMERHFLGVTGSDWDTPLFERILVAGHALWFYLGKLLWPHPLMFIYPRWSNLASHAMGYLPLLAAFGGMLLLWWKRNSRAKPVAVAMAYFVILIFPLLGVLKGYFFRYTFVSDHFQYLASMGPLALAAAGIVTGLGLLRMPLLKPAVGAALLLALSILTWVQCGVYANNEKLWRDALKHNPDAWMAHNNLGIELINKGRFEEARGHFIDALKLRPRHAPAYYNMGRSFASQGRFQEAITNYQKAIEFEPKYSFGFYSLGGALANLGRFDEAIPYYQKAIQIAPTYAPAHFFLGLALASTGKNDEAIESFRRTVQIDPAARDAWMALGNALAAKGRIDESLDCFRSAVKADPKNADILAVLGNALLASGKLDEALDSYRRILQINPRHGGVLINMGNALLNKGRFEEAVDAYRKAVALDPNHPGIRFNLGMALLRQGKFKEAREQLVEAVRLKPDFSAAQQQLQLLDSTQGGAIKQ